MNRAEMSKWVERNPFFAIAVTMMSVGLLAGIAKLFFHSEEFLDRASLLCIMASIVFACMALAQDIFKKDSRRKKSG